MAGHAGDHGGLLAVFLWRIRLRAAAAVSGRRVVRLAAGKRGQFSKRNARLTRSLILNPTGFVTEVFDFKVPMTPLVVLPLLALGTVFLAYLASFIILRVVRGTAKRVSLTLDGRF